MDLLMLAPDIQEAILCGGATPPARLVLPIAGRAGWSEQRLRWRELPSIADVGAVA